MLLHNDAGGPTEAAERVNTLFGEEANLYSTSLREMRANFATVEAQGSQAYAQQFQADHPEFDGAVLASDAVMAVKQFCNALPLQID